MADANATAMPDETTAWSTLTGTINVKPGDGFPIGQFPQYETTFLNSTFGNGAVNEPTPEGTSTFANIFNGATAGGNWTLYMADGNVGDITSISSWTLSFNTSAGSQGTSTAIASNLNPGTTGTASVTYTATVTTGANVPVTTGTVTFTSVVDGSVTVNTWCSGVALSGSGQATCNPNVPASKEGNHTFTATYSGTPSFGTSFQNLDETYRAPTTGTAPQFCNANPVGFPGTTPQAVYPSIVHVTNESNSIASLTVTLNGLQSAPGGTSFGGLQMMLVAPSWTTSNKQALEFFSEAGPAGAAQSTAVNLVLADGSTRVMQQTLSNGTYGPASYTSNTPDLYTAPAPSGNSPAQFYQAAPTGSASFESAFDGATADGDWLLYVQASGTSDAAQLTGGWCINLTLNSGTSTTTTLTSNPAPNASKGQTVMFTAVVAPIPSTGGTVTFTENGSPLGPAATVTSGVATLSTAALLEGDHTITATYHDPVGTYNNSTGTAALRVDNATTSSFTSGIWNFCNTAGIMIPSVTTSPGDIGPATPNPSNIFVTGLPGTINIARLTLNSFQFQSPKFLESLLVGPNGGAAPGSAQTLDFFSLTTSNSLLGPATFTFDDAGTGLSGSTGVVPASDGATSYTASPFYILPTSFQHASTLGSSTFNSVYTNKDGNGTWSLYFNQTINESSPGQGATGWCLNLTMNPPTLGVTKSHTGPGAGNAFVTGQGGTYTITVMNNGPGSTGGQTVTVSDPMPAGMTITLPVSGGGDWDCTTSTTTQVTCTSTAVKAAAANFSNIVFTVTPAQSSGTSVTNTATATATGMNTGMGSDGPTTIIHVAVLSLVNTDNGSPTHTFTQGDTGKTATFTLSNASAASGAGPTTSAITITFASSSGLTPSNITPPANWTCNPASASFTCSSTASPALAAGGTVSFTLPFSVSGTATSPQTIAASTTGGGGNLAISTDTLTINQIALLSATPNTGQQGQSNLNVALVAVGTHFVQGTSVATFGAGITVNNLTVTDTTHATANITMSPSATTGASNVTVTTGAEVVTLTNGFTVTAGTPVLTTVNPNTGQQGQTNLNVALTGQFTHFVQGTSVATFGTGITVNSLTVNSATSATANISIAANAATGASNVTVTTGAEVVTLTNGFTVTSGTPILTTVNPNTGQQGQTSLNVALTGQFTHFVQGTSVATFGTGITVNNLTVNSAASATANITISPSAPAGVSNVTVTTGAEVVTLTNGFTVTNGTPVLTSATPNSGSQGQSSLNVGLVGNFTHFVQGTSVATFGTGITVNSLTVNSATNATANISIAVNAPAGASNVTVTTGAEVVTLTNGFTVLQVPTTLNVTGGNNQSATVGLTFGSPLSVQVLDGNGVGINGLTVTFTPVPAAGSSGTFAGNVNTATTNPSGNATSVLLTANTVAGSYSVTVTAGPLTKSFSLTNIAGAATHFSVTAASPETAGTAFNITVTALDQYANTVTGYQGTVHFTSSDTSAVLPANYSFVGGDNGVHVFSVTLVTLGMKTITATDTVTAPITGSATIMVSGTAPSITTNPTNQTVNAGSTAVFTAAASGNPTPTVQWQVNTGGGFVNITSATSTTLTLNSVTAAMNGNLYQAVFSNGVTPNAPTTAATLTVDFGPTIGTSPTSQTINLGSPVTFLSSATGNPTPTVLWYSSTDGTNFFPIAGATSTTLTFTPVAGDSGKQYRATFTNTLVGGSTPTANTNAATLNFNFYLLTTAASPTIGGSVQVTNPSGNGMYFPGSIQTITAVPNAGYSFLNWTGNVANANSAVTTVTMAGPESVTANFVLLTNFVTGFALNSPPLRNDYTGFVGMQFTVGVNPIIINTVGRVCVAGNSQMHVVKLVSGSTKADVPNGSATVNMAGCTGGTFVYSPLTTPVNLPAGATYYLVSMETINGDTWYEHGAITTTTDASVISSEYFDGTNWIGLDSANTSYVPTNMGYTVVHPPPNPAFVQNYNQNNQPLRNDFTGFAGMNLLTGPSALSVTQIGRVCVAGNSQTHTVKYVNPSTGADVPLSSVTVNMAGCTPGQFVYATLAQPLTLSAATMYYLVSSETSGGDQWYDQNTLVTKTDAQVLSSVYTNAGSYQPNALNTSYVPPNFIYTVVTGGGGAVSVMVGTNQPGTSFSVDGLIYTSQQTFAWISGTTHTIATTSPQAAGAGTRYVFTGWSDSGTIAHTVSPTANTSYTANFKTQYRLTTAVTPAGGGTIGATPSSGDGYYDSGTPVSLQATANPGYAFFNWTGDLSDSVNPQSLTLSAPHTATANFQSVPGAGGFITGFALNAPALRNDFSGFAGMTVKLGSNPLSVSGLGRVCVAGNSQTHVVKFVNALTGADVPGASATVNMAGCTAGQFTYAAIAPVTLSGGATYYEVSQETPGGDQWYNLGQVTSKTDAAVQGPVYSSGASWIPISGPNTAYVPPDFQYTVLAPAGPQPLLTGFGSQALRSDFSGFVGMTITVGSSNLSVSSVGRVCVAGNTGTHTVKLVNAATGVDVAGGSASVAMTGCTPGTFQYATLGSAVTLSSATSYYLVSLESNGGDQWYDQGPVTPTSAAQVSGAVYQFNGTWYPNGSMGFAYVPTNMLYQLAP